MNDIPLPPEIQKILDQLTPDEAAKVKKILVDQKKKSEMEDQMEAFQSAQDQNAATAPSPQGQQKQYQSGQMFNPKNLAGLGGSLMQMSLPLDQSTRQQLQLGRRNREDELYGFPMLLS